MVCQTSFPAGMMLGFFFPPTPMLNTCLKQRVGVRSAGTQLCQAEHGIKPGVRAETQVRHLLLSTDPDDLLIGCFLPCEKNFTISPGCGSGVRIVSATCNSCSQTPSNANAKGSKKSHQGLCSTAGAGDTRHITFNVASSLSTKTNSNLCFSPN